MGETEYNISPGGSRTHELTPTQEVIDAGGKPGLKKDKRLDGEDAWKRLKRVQNWLSEEIEWQSTERSERLKDHEYYDSHQWNDEDAEEVENRGQEAIVFNIIKQSADALTGQQIQSAIDYQILPRTSDDVKGAEIKTKVFKYVEDVNNHFIHRTWASKDQIISGLGWVDTGIRTDPTKEPVYYKYEDWRNCWYDHLAQGPDYLNSGRYVFRLKWTDLDVATAMFPDRAGQILNATGRTMSDYLGDGWTDDVFPFQGEENDEYSAGIGTYDLYGLSARRNRVLLCECQYKMMYQSVKLLKGKGLGTLSDIIYDQKNSPIDEVEWLIKSGYAGLVDAITTVTRQMIFTGDHVLQDDLIPYNHNRFSLVPLFAFRRKKTGEPYGIIRPLRGPQDDFNKRRSKALYQLSSNRVIADDDATDDWDTLHEEANRTDGLVKKRPGSEVNIQSEHGIGMEHAHLAEQDLGFIERIGGVPDEARGLETNATSRVGIEARANFGQVVNSEIHQNRQFFDQQAGQNVLSLIEQYMPDEKILRLVDDDGGVEFETINQTQPDGTILNDITAAQADYTVSATPFTATQRQAAWRAIGDVIGTLPENIQLALLALWAELSDLPGLSTRGVKLIRQVTGIDDRPEEDLDDEELAAKQAAAEEQARQKQLNDKLLEMEMALKEAQALKQRSAAGKDDAQTHETYAKIDKIYVEIKTLKEESDNARQQTRIKKAEALHKIETEYRKPLGGNANDRKT